MAGRELIRELHEATYRRLVIELLAYVDDLTSAEATAHEAFAAAYRDGRAVDAAVSPHDELRQRAIEVIARRTRKHQLLDRPLRRRPRPAGADSRLSADANDTLVGVTSLPDAQREAAVLHYLADLTDDEIAAAMAVPPSVVGDLLVRADAAMRANLDGDRPRHRQRLEDLAIDLRRAIGMPPFDEVVATVSRRRRRLIAWTAVGALAIAGGVVVSVAHSAGPAGSPASAATPPTGQTAAVRRALAAQGTTMYAVARSPAGIWASFWYCRSCAIERSFALLSRDGFQHAHVVPLRVDGQGDAWATQTGDFVVSSGVNGALQVIAPDGSVSSLGGSPYLRPRPASPDDLVVTSFGVGPPNVPMVIDPVGLRQWPLRVPDFHDPGAVNLVESQPNGDLWGLHLFGPRRAPGVVYSHDGGRTWVSRLFPQAGGDPRLHHLSPFGRALATRQGTVAFLSLPTDTARGPELVLSPDAGVTWAQRIDPRDTAGRRIRVNDVTLGEPGRIVVAGFDADGVARVWVGDSIDDYHALRPVLREQVTFTRPPLDRPGAIWATAPQAIWESDDGGLSWDLLINHHTWQNIQVVSDSPRSQSPA